jgi:hypothetical protein
MKTFLLCCFLLITVVAGRPEEASSTTEAAEAIEDLEEDLDSSETTEPALTDDQHCEEVEKLKDYYCTTAHCKHFYSKHCYDIIDGVHPTCEKVETIIIILSRSMFLNLGSSKKLLVMLCYVRLD